MVGEKNMASMIRKTLSLLTDLQQAVLIFLVSVLPPVITLLGLQSTDVFLYASAILGGILAFAIKYLGTSALESVTEEPKASKKKSK